MRRVFVAVVILLVSVIRVLAQSEPEYRMEIGLGTGMMTYEGDFNDGVFKEMQPMATIMARRVLNPYMAFRLAATYGKIKGSSQNVETYYPDFQTTPYEFSNSLVDVSLTYEYNFWPYGTGRDYRGAQRLTPFVFGGLGITSASGNGKSATTANVPIGLGLKYKIAPRLNLGLEWAVHFSMSDKLDGVADPYYVKSSGPFKNTDCYSVLQLSLTYSFWAKCKVCHNQDE